MLSSRPSQRRLQQYLVHKQPRRLFQSNSKRAIQVESITMDERIHESLWESPVCSLCACGPEIKKADAAQVRLMPCSRRKKGVYSTCSASVAIVHFPWPFSWRFNPANLKANLPQVSNLREGLCRILRSIHRV
jgi:hypothetical protein